MWLCKLKKDSHGPNCFEKVQVSHRHHTSHLNVCGGRRQARMQTEPDGKEQGLGSLGGTTD